MDYKHCCVVDAKNRYIDLVLVVAKPNKDGQMQEQIQYYTLQQGETLLDVPRPTQRTDTGGTGLVHPRWNGTAWEESATPAEIAAWEAEHPAPPMPPAPPPDPRDLAITQLMREVAALKAKEGEHIG